MHTTNNGVLSLVLMDTLFYEEMTVLPKAGQNMDWTLDFNLAVEFYTKMHKRAYWLSMYTLWYL